jgi:hypothetical protein
MEKTESEVRRTSWIGKLLLSILAGCPFSIGIWWFLSMQLMFATFAQQVVALLLMACVPLSAVGCGVFLYVREGKTCGRSLLQGAVVGLVGTAIIIMIQLLFVAWHLSAP